MSELTNNGTGQFPSPSVLVCLEAGTDFADLVRSYTALEVPSAVNLLEALPMDISEFCGGDTSSVELCESIYKNLTESAPEMTVDGTPLKDLYDFSMSYLSTADLVNEALDILTVSFQNKAAEMYPDCADLRGMDIREVLSFLYFDDEDDDCDGCIDCEDCDGCTGCDHCDDLCNGCTGCDSGENDCADESTNIDEDKEPSDASADEERPAEGTTESTVSIEAVVTESEDPAVGTESATDDESSDSDSCDDLIDPDAPFEEKMEMVFAFTFFSYQTYEKAPDEAKKAVDLLREAHATIIGDCASKLQSFMLNHFNSVPPETVSEYYYSIADRATLIAKLRDLVDPEYYIENEPTTSDDVAAE